MNTALGDLGTHQAELRTRGLASGEKLGLSKDWPVCKGGMPPRVLV